MYNKYGYMDIVSRAAEESMQRAVEEVQSLTHYEVEGEVSSQMCTDIHIWHQSLTSCSGSSLMPVMTPLPTPVISPSPAFLEGQSDNINITHSFTKSFPISVLIG